MTTRVHSRTVRMFSITASLDDLVALVEDVRRTLSTGTMPPIIAVVRGNETTRYDTFEELRSDLSLPPKLIDLYVSVKAPMGGAQPDSEFTLALLGYMGGLVNVTAASDTTCVMVKALVDSFATKARVWYWWLLSNAVLITVLAMLLVVLAVDAFYLGRFGHFGWLGFSSGVPAGALLAYIQIRTIKPLKCEIVLRRIESWWSRNQGSLTTVAFLVTAVATVAALLVNLLKHS